MNTLLVRTPTELDAMRAAGQAVAQTLQAVRAAAVPGVRLRELDDLAQTMSREAGAVSPFLGAQPSWAPTPFNGVLCLSPNEIVVHGKPNGRRLREGDLPSIDCGAIIDGWNGDAAITVHVGEASDDDVRLVIAAEQALQAGIAAAVPGATLLDVAVAVDHVAQAHGFSHLADHGGHGIGREMREAPFVPNEPTRDTQHRFDGDGVAGVQAVAGHAGTSRYRTKKDGWSIATADGERAAHVEHTVAVTDDRPEILTARS